MLITALRYAKLTTLVKGQRKLNCHLTSSNWWLKRLLIKLFSAEEVKTSKATELARDVVRTADIKKALDVARTELNDANSSFEIALADQRVKWLSEEEKAIAKIRDLSLELTTLQKQKAELLIPIDSDRKKVDNMIKEAKDIMSEAIHKQSYADELSEKLQDRLDEVSETQQSLQAREEHLFVKEKGIESQEVITKQNAQALSEQLQSWLVTTTSKETDLLERKIALDMKEMTLADKLKSLEDREQQIEKDKQLIYSQRMALKAALQELQEKKS